MLFKHKQWTFYLIRIHPELNFIQNILLNCGLLYIEELKNDIEVQGEGGLLVFYVLLYYTFFFFDYSIGS